MKEILGHNLDRYFAYKIGAFLMYAGKDYQVWQVTDYRLDRMRAEDSDEFVEKAGEDAWWRYAIGCTLPKPSGRTIEIVNRERMIAFDARFSYDTYTCLTEYLCDAVGASNEKNVCACSVELARANKMKLWEFWKTYQGDK